MSLFTFFVVVEDGASKRGGELETGLKAVRWRFAVNADSFFSSMVEETTSSNKHKMKHKANEYCFIVFLFSFLFFFYSKLELFLVLQILRERRRVFGQTVCFHFVLYIWSLEGRCGLGIGLLLVLVFVRPI